MRLLPPVSAQGETVQGNNLDNHFENFDENQSGQLRRQESIRGIEFLLEIVLGKVLERRNLLLEFVSPIDVHLSFLSYG